MRNLHKYILENYGREALGVVTVGKRRGQASGLQEP